MRLLVWEVVCQPLKDGGFGIQSLIARQEVLIARHTARFLLDPESPWSTVMRPRYRSWNMGEEIQPSQGASFMWWEIYARALEVITQMR